MYADVVRDRSQRFTMRDVAVEAGVSVATVSRVLNDNPSVASDTRAAVMAVIQRQRYSAQRRRPRPGGMEDVVAVRCPYVLSDYFGVILSSIAQTLAHYGKRLLLSAEAEDGNEPSLSQLLLSDTTVGAVLILPPEPAPILAGLNARDYPFVVVDPRTPAPPDVAAVSAAHLTGARLATEHLIKLGHERIATISGPLDCLATDGRLLGYRAALAHAGRLAPEELVRFGGEPTVEHGYEAAGALLDLADPPTAIVAYNDKVAVGALQAAAERRLVVPRDLSVVGFDASDLSALVVPRLTTVRQPLVEMGRLAVELLLSLIDGRKIATLHVELATELIVRESTAPPRRARP